MSTQQPQVLGHPISHVSYLVEDLEKAAQIWAETFGAGPFLLMEGIAPDVADHFGGPATWHHSTAFGQWGPIAVELQQLISSEPETLREKVGGTGPFVNHVAIIVPDPVAESARLEALGMPCFLTATFGPIVVRMHDAPQLGHPIEIHEDNDAINGLLAQVREASIGWDGKDPLRPVGDLPF